VVIRIRTEGSGRRFFRRFEFSIRLRIRPPRRAEWRFENRSSVFGQQSPSELGNAIGAGWAKPSKRTHGPGKRDEWVLETSYKFQLGKNLSLTPDLQILINPANNPEKNSIWVAGVRLIVVL